MSAMRLQTTEGIYSSKEGQTLAAHKHGATGWKETESSSREAMIYFCPQVEGEGLWLPAESYIRQIQQRKNHNRQFYLNHPHLLKKKIQEKRRPQIFAHSLYR